MKEINLSTNHPELRADEIFLLNVDSEYRLGNSQVVRIKPESALQMNFNKLPYANKRMGKIAYDSEGKENPEERPVFVNRLEFEQKNLHNV
ncbi:MAG: hypothetical protein WCO58_00950 [bacterium]